MTKQDLIELGEDAEPHMADRCEQLTIGEEVTCWSLIVIAAVVFVAITAAVFA